MTDRIDGPPSADPLADVTVIFWCKDHKCLEYNCPPGTTSHRLAPFGSMSAVREVVERLRLQKESAENSLRISEQGAAHRLATLQADLELCQRVRDALVHNIKELRNGQTRRAGRRAMGVVSAGTDNDCSVDCSANERLATLQAEADKVKAVCATMEEGLGDLCMQQIAIILTLTGKGGE